MRRIKKLIDVVEWRMCLGCGICAYVCPEHRVQLMDFIAEGIRPVVASSECGSCRLCLDACPAVQIDYRISSPHTGKESKDAFIKEWGLVLALWEGHAADSEIRFKGSSGGALSAIGIYCIEVLKMHGVLHTAQDPDDPIRNRTCFSRSRDELLATTGSRYSPASVCDGLGLVESAPARCAIIGKPVDIAAVTRARQLRRELDRNVGLTLSFFCAETPSTQGTMALLEKLGVPLAEVSGLRYRGFGWPGFFEPIRRGESEPRQKMTYHESWSFLQAFRPWSVRLWPDGAGELADITCGDPWYKQPDGRNPGYSLVLARTDRGREVIKGAIAAGYLRLEPAENWKLVKSQSGLLAKKGSVWGRRLAMRLFGLPVTRLEGIYLWHCWRQLSFREELQSIVGTVRRIFTRKLYRPLRLNPKNGVPVKPAVGQRVE